MVQTQEQSERGAAIKALREKHGFPGGSLADWSHRILASRDGELQADMPPQYDMTADPETGLPRNPPPQDGKWHPKNEPLLAYLAEKFAWAKFSWEAFNVEEEVNLKQGGKGTRRRNWVNFTNYPRIGGQSVTLTDLFILPVELFDGYDDKDARVQSALVGLPATAEFKTGMGRIVATGVGYKGLSGVSWLPGLTEMPLGSDVEQQIVDLGRAIFGLTDAVAALWEGDHRVRSLLQHRVPGRIPRIAARQRVSIIRPDIVLIPHGESFRPVCTELESCPAGQGMTHAMQLAYGLPTEMVDRFIELLDGRPFTVVATNQWAEYVWDQASFVWALRERGVNARMVFDRPLNEIQIQVNGDGPLAWKIPAAVTASVRAQWNSDFLGRLQALDWIEFVCGGELPESLPGVVFRFGYFDNFSPGNLARMERWIEQGTEIVNGLDFWHESKVVMAAIGLESVQSWIVERHGTEMLQVLHDCVATTRLLDPSFCNLAELREQRAYWLTKFAAWDGDNQSWGSRSLELGSACGQEAWSRSLEARMGLHHPVVAQHVIRSAQFSRCYVGADSRVAMLTGARIRVTPFLLRLQDGSTAHAGSTATLRSGTFRIHGATDAVEVPIRFQTVE